MTTRLGAAGRVGWFGEWEEVPTDHWGGKKGTTTKGVSWPAGRGSSGKGLLPQENKCDGVFELERISIRSFYGWGGGQAVERHTTGSQHSGAAT